MAICKGWRRALTSGRTTSRSASISASPRTTQNLIAERQVDTGLAPIDKAVLWAAREITLDGKVADDTYAALADHFSNEHLIDLVTMAFYNAVVRFLPQPKWTLKKVTSLISTNFPAGLTDPHRKEPIPC